MLRRQLEMVDRAARAVAADGVQLRHARERFVTEVRREVAKPRTLLAALALGVVTGALLGPGRRRAGTTPSEAVMTREAPTRGERARRLVVGAVTLVRLLDGYVSSGRPR